MDSGTHSNCCIANNAGRRAEKLVNILHTFTGGAGSFPGGKRACLLLSKYDCSSNLNTTQVRV
jgi:hypothetical protein